MPFFRKLTGGPRDLVSARFAHFTESQIRDVYQFMYRQVGDRDVAEDLTTRVFSQAMRRLPSLPARVSVERLLDETARAVLRDALRTRRHDSADAAACGEPLGRTDVPASQRPDRQQALREAQRILALLSAPERDLLTHRLILNRTLASAAAAMRLSNDAAMALQWSALTHAAQIMAEADESEAPPERAR